MTTVASQLPTKPNYPEVLLEDKISVVLSRKVYAQISYMLQKISKVEWSAILLYTTEGHITNPSKMICTIDSIYAMDKGSSAYTEHTYDTEDIVDMFDDFPEYMGMRIGHVHSHNNMASFFSGTDKGELHNNAPNHVYYLSLIVNNEGSFIAKLAYMGKRLVKSRTGVLSKFGKWTWSKLDTQQEEDVLFIHDCNITFQMTDGMKFTKRVADIIKRADAKPVSVPPVTIINQRPIGFGKQPFKSTKRAWDNWDDRWDNDFPPAYTKVKTTPTPNYVTHLKERTMLAKAILSCDMAHILDPLYQLSNKAESEMLSIDDSAISDSYKEFFTISSPTFLQNAFKDIYGEDAEAEYDMFTIELEASMDMLTGRVGDCIREAIDDIIIDWEIERGMDEGEDLPITESPAYLSEFMEGKV